MTTHREVGRPEKSIDFSRGPVAEFAAGLRALRDKAGRPPYRELATRAGYSPAVLSQAAAGRDMPSWAVVEAFVTACGGDSESWRQRWRSFQQAAHREETNSRYENVEPGQIADLPSGTSNSTDEMLYRNLGPQELRILSQITAGRTNREIAAELHLAEKTVKNHVSSILNKLQCGNRTEAAVFVTRLKPPPAPRGRYPPTFGLANAFLVEGREPRTDSLTEGLRFNILGPIEVANGSTQVRIPPGRQPTILGALLLEPNRVVNIDRLIDVVWDETPPVTARTQVQICVSALRHMFADLGVGNQIETRPPGYMLRVTEGQIDNQIFAALVAGAARAQREGQPAEAVRLLRQAVGLWRGPALGGETGAVLRSAAVRLEEARLNALETCIELELNLSRHQLVIGELGGLVEEYPLRERLRGHLMTALYRAGRAAEALEVYRAGRRIMDDELGIQPGEELRQLERAIRNEDPRLEPATANGLRKTLLKRRRNRTVEGVGWSTFPSKVQVVMAVHTVAAAMRLKDLVGLLDEDPEIGLAYTAVPDRLGDGVDALLQKWEVKRLAWEDAVGRNFDLAIGAGLHRLGDLRARRTLAIAHGSGYNKRWPSWAWPGSDEKRPTYGLDRDSLLDKARRPVVDALNLSHVDQWETLKRQCPEATNAAIVGGDPSFDRLQVSLPSRQYYRDALGVRDGQTLVAVASTWGQGSLLSRRPELLMRLLNELPANHKIVLTAHPAVWFEHGPRRIRTLLRDARHAGLEVIDAGEDWQGLLAAADFLVADHTSVSVYGAASGVPFLLSHLAEDEIEGDSVMSELAQLSPRLDDYTPLIGQLAAAAEARPMQQKLASERVTSVPGESAKVLRKKCYQLLELEEPTTEPRAERVLPPRLMRNEGVLFGRPEIPRGQGAQVFDEFGWVGDGEVEVQQS